MAQVCAEQGKIGLASIRVSSVPIRGLILVAIKSYFDGGGTGLHKDRFLTLACVALDDDGWPEVEQAWDKHRCGTGIEDPLHMTDAMALEGGFKGWSPEKRDWAINSMIDSVSQFRQKDLLRYFAISVNLRDHREVKRAKSIPSAPRLAARSVFPHMLDWYREALGGSMSAVDLTFDKSEPFIRHLRADWENKKYLQRHPGLRVIRTMATASMKGIPALQIADMVAWSRNYLEIHHREPPDAHFGIALRASRVIEGLTFTVDKDWLLKTPLPEEGYEAINPQRRIDRA